MEERMVRGCVGGEILPRDFISDVLMLTSPRDSCRMSLVSSTFRSAAGSDPVWEKFLPSDYPKILPRAVAPVEFSSKKELYFRLCDSIFIDDGNVSFSLDRLTGKMCYMFSPRPMRIVWGHDPKYWRYVPSHPESRFPEVAELLEVWWLEMGGDVGNIILSPRTNYGAYFIFKLNQESSGFDFPSQEASIRFGEHACEREVFLQPAANQEMAEGPRWREDGWMEIEMGDFFNDEGVAMDVGFRFRQVQVMNRKCGLIFQGIELRPKSLIEEL